MKILRNIVVALCAVFTLTACGGGNPESVAKNFQEAILDMDFEKAASYATKSSATLLKGMASMLPTDQLQELKKEAKGAKIKVVGSEIDGDTATVTLELTNADGETDEADVDLIKEDGSWKVVFEK